MVYLAQICIIEKEKLLIIQSSISSMFWSPIIYFLLALTDPIPTCFALTITVKIIHTIEYWNIVVKEKKCLDIYMDNEAERKSHYNVRTKKYNFVFEHFFLEMLIARCAN